MMHLTRRGVVAVGTLDGNPLEARAARRQLCSQPRMWQAGPGRAIWGRFVGQEGEACDGVDYGAECSR